MADWQCRFLPHGLFPRLGPRFVRRWHATFLDAPHGLALIAEVIGTAERVPVGFLVGSTDHIHHVDDVIRRHRLSLGLAGLIALAGRPRLSMDFLRTRSGSYARRLLGRPAKRAGTDTESEGSPRPLADRPHVAVITAIVVDPAARGAGVGEMLVTGFLTQAIAAGAPEAELVTMDGAEGAGPFYERLGWRQLQRHTIRDGHRMRTYRFNLASSTSATHERINQRRASRLPGRPPGQRPHAPADDQAMEGYRE